MWALVNGVALANRDKTVFLLGSDGSQQEGNDAEAARLAVAQGLNIKLLIDDNDVTIAGHPSQYLKGYDLTKTLEGHGLKVVTVQGEDIDALWGAVHAVCGGQGRGEYHYSWGRYGQGSWKVAARGMSQVSRPLASGASDTGN